ncbi:MAG: hypothetical protein WDO70_01475 [Alphaproteobacteria bacterium]
MAHKTVQFIAQAFLQAGSEEMQHFYLGLLTGAVKDKPALADSVLKRALIETQNADPAMRRDGLALMQAVASFRPDLSGQIFEAAKRAIQADGYPSVRAAGHKALGAALPYCPEDRAEALRLTRAGLADMAQIRVVAQSNLGFIAGFWPDLSAAATASAEAALHRPPERSSVSASPRPFERKQHG